MVKPDGFSSESPSRHDSDVRMALQTGAVRAEAPRSRIRPRTNVERMDPTRPQEAPPTILVVHPRENRKKCSVEPLRAHSGFRFWTFPKRGPEPLDGYVRLASGGPLLSAADARNGLLVLDGTWRLAQRMAPFFAELPVRSLPEWVTAYPRASKTFPDPGA